jgi:methionine synthase II (cobalamin-independent)
MSSSPRNPPFRAEHIGSLLRPEELVKHRYAVADGSKTDESLVPVEQAAIKEVVKLQQDCGIHSLTNGEYSRHMCTYNWQNKHGSNDLINHMQSGGHSSKP